MGSSAQILSSVFVFSGHSISSIAKIGFKFFNILYFCFLNACSDGAADDSFFIKLYHHRSL